MKLDVWINRPSMSCGIVSLEMNPEYEYGLLPGTHQLLPIVTTVACTGVTSILTQLDTSSLPFGLLDRVRVNVEVPYRVHVAKITGRKETPRVEHATAQSLVVGAMSSDQDAADPDLALVKATTGHAMAFRMMAAAGIVSMAIEFYQRPPPAEFTVTFYGANTVPLEMTAADVRERLGAKTKVPFGMSYLTPKQRLSNAQRRVQEDEESKSK